MKLLCQALLPALLAHQALAQPTIRYYVQQHPVPVASIQPSATNDADLAAIGQAIGGARIVLLGEQDHGDGATFLAKTRLIKYLHEQKGFTILAFEGDFFALNQGWESLPKEAGAVRRFVRDNVYNYWSQCLECEELLYDYLPRTYQTASPLRLAGIDNQLYGSFSPGAYSRRELPGYLSAWLTREGSAYAATKAYQEFFIPFLDTLSQPQYFATRPPTYLIANKQGKLRRFVVAVDTLLGQLAPGAQAAYGGRLLQNLRVLAQESAVFTENDTATYNLRDAQLARNLNWLANERYPTEKILVWAANHHISKGTSSDYKLTHRAITWMGTRFMAANSANAAQTYVLGFTSKLGASRRVGAAQPTALPPPPRNSFETWLPAQLPYAFVDFRAFHAQFPASREYFWLAGGQHTGELADWTRIYDGIFYIRDMTPCGPSSLAKPGN